MVAPLHPLGGIVQQISATFSHNYAKNRKGAKFRTNETDSIQINNRLGGILKISNRF